MKLHLPVILRNAVMACFSLVAFSTLYSGNLATAADLTLGDTDSLSIDYAETDSVVNLMGGSLQLQGDTQLILSNCGEGDGKLYTLFTGVSQLTDKDGNILSAGDYSVADYFNTDLRGTGFWANANLQLTQDGTLQLVLHNNTVKSPLEVTTQQAIEEEYQYYESATFNDNTSTSEGGAIYGGSYICNNGSVTFSENTASHGGGLLGCSSTTITLSNNGSVTFSENTASIFGGAIIGWSWASITLSNNGSVTFSENTASTHGGAILGERSSTITLSNNSSVTFSGNTASASGGAIYGSSSTIILLSNNGSVTFSGNTASANGGAIYGGAIYGGSSSTILLSNNGSVTFRENKVTASSSYHNNCGGAICTSGHLNIQNNDNVLFEKNTEIRNSTYLLRSIYAGGSGDIISLSAKEGAKLEFRDSLYIASDSTVNLNAEYTDSEGIVHQQTGDIIFTGKYTEAHLNELLEAYGVERKATETEILNSLTTEVNAMTNLYGGRLRVEDGAIFKGYGITTKENSAATVLVKDAQLNHHDYDLTFHDGTTLELTGGNIVSGHVRMMGNSTLLLNIAETSEHTDIIGSMDIAGAIALNFIDTEPIENKILLYVSGELNNWTGGSFADDSKNCIVTWVDNLLVMNYNASTFSYYFNGSASHNTQPHTKPIWHHYQTLTFENCSTDDVGGVIFGGICSTIALCDNGSVFINENSASNYGGAVYGGENSNITLNTNGDVTFRGNTANYGGAIYGNSCSTITLSNNGNVVFSENTANYGGAINSSGNLRIQNNDSVLFEKNAEIKNGTYRLRSIYAGGSGDIISLSAMEGGKIEFRDSLYIDSGSTVNLNAVYTVAEGVVHQQTGDIIFTGKYTEAHLNELLEADGVARKATESEVLNSRTTEVNAMTNLYGGRLRVEDGAIYKGYGITAIEGSASTVLVKNAELNHQGYNLIFNTGTTLELQEKNSISGNVQMLKGSTLIIDAGFLTPDSIPHITGGEFEVLGNVLISATIDLSLLESNSHEYIIGDGTYTWNPEYVETDFSIDWCNKVLGVSKNPFFNSQGNLVVGVRSSENVTWVNATGDGQWNNRSANWVDGDYRYAYVQGTNVTLSKIGAGVVTLDGNISIGNMTIEGGSTYELQLNENSSLQMKGSLSIGQGARLTLDTGISVTELDNQGELTLDGALAVTGEILGMGVLTANSLTAGSLNASSLLLTDKDANNTINGTVTVDGEVDIAGNLSVGGMLSGATINVGNLLVAGSLTADSLEASSLHLTDAVANSVVNKDIVVAGAAEIAGSLSTSGLFSSTSANVGGYLSASILSLTDKEANNTANGSVTVDGAVDIAGNLSVGGILSSTTINVGNLLVAGSLTADSLEASSLHLTDAEANSVVNKDIVVAGAAEIAGSLSTGGLFSSTSANVGGYLSASILSLADKEANNTVNGSVTVDGAVDIAGNLSVGGILSGTTINVGNLLVAGSLTADSLEASSLHLTDAEASNVVNKDVVVAGAVDIAGNISVGGVMNGKTINVDGTLSAASLTADSLSADALSLTTVRADNTVNGEVKVSGDIVSAGNLNAGSLVADNVSTATLALTVIGTTNTVSGNLTANCVSLAAGAELSVGGTLTADEVQMNGNAKTLTADSFGSDSMNFVLDRAALETLNLGYGESGSIARADEAMGRDFTATLNGNIEPVQAAAYTYSISVSGGDVKLTADYAHDGLKVWYRGDWVGQSRWSDYYVAGYDSVDGVETMDLAGETVEGDNLYIAYEDEANITVLTNGVLEFGYVDMGGGQFELGEGAEMITDELYGKGETLKMYDGSVLDTTDLTLGTLDMQGGEVTVKTATIKALTGTEGTLNIARRGDVSVNSDVTLTGLDNEGILVLEGHVLTVNALVKNGGNVIAGEVKVQSSGSRMASFDELVADKVTVENAIQTGRYTDDLSVGDGSSIGELVAETLEVREGTVNLGRSNGSTNINLLNLNLQQDTTLELNQQTMLTVSNELSATEQAIVKLNNGAGISYGDFSVSNKGASTPTEVNAYELSEGELPSLSNAHVAVNSSRDTTISTQLTNSAVQNLGSGTLTVNHKENSLTDIYATGGDIVVMNAANLNLQELEVAAGMSLSAYVENISSPDYEAMVSVSSKATLGAGATLNADLVIEAGATLELGGPVDMGSDLYLSSGTTLGGNMLTMIQSAELGSRIDLFTGIDSLYFNGVKQNTLTIGDGVSAEQYFCNLTNELNRYYYLIFDDSLAGEGVLSIEVSSFMVPEPTTTTLSLLALAGLAARRRRKS